MIARYTRGWKVGFITALELTGKETEASFPSSSRGSSEPSWLSERKGI